MRKNIFGIDSNTLVVGDKLICRQNCWDVILEDNSLNIDIALVNGLIGTVTGVDKNTGNPSGRLNINFKPEFSNVSFRNIPVNPTHVLNDYVHRKAVNPKFNPDVLFEFGYCSTCHLAQGSQYPHIVIYLDSTPSTSDYFKKWLYTAITRAKLGLTLVM